LCACLNAVKLNEDYYWRLPRQLSGGEKQRVGIARAIASNPTMVVCDEPVSALDVSVQAAVLTLLQELQQQRSTAMILISHDLSAVRFLSDDVAVMYLGRVRRKGALRRLFTGPPHHPYTAALLAAVPRADPSAPQRRIRLSGNVPSAVDPPIGLPLPHTAAPLGGRDLRTGRAAQAGAGRRAHNLLPSVAGAPLGDQRVSAPPCQARGVWVSRFV
jgi:peptide/nickel transport system ATP-binding protein